jgi:ferredoxin
VAVGKLSTTGLFISLIFNAPGMKLFKLMDKYLSVNDVLCNNCGLCIKRCPVGNIVQVVKRDGRPSVIFKGECIHCFRCINRCPQKALRLQGFQEVNTAI